MSFIPITIASVLQWKYRNSCVFHPQNTATASSGTRFKPCHSSALFLFREYSSFSLTPGHLEQPTNLWQLNSSECQRSYLLRGEKKPNPRAMSSCVCYPCVVSLQSSWSWYFQHSPGDIFVCFLKSSFLNIRTSLLTLSSIQISVMKILLLISQLVSSPEYMSL